MEDSYNQEHSQEQPPRLIAQADLSEPGNTQNRALLTEQALQVYYRGKGRAFSLAYVERLALEHRKLWLPLIGGGILACLCLLALMQTFNMPYRLLTGATIGAVGVWWGIRGSMALVVYEQRHHNDFLLSYVNKSLPTFIAFANRVIRRYPTPLGNYWLAVSLQEWAQLQQEGTLTLTAPKTCEPEEQASRKHLGPQELWLAIDPLEVGPRLRWTLREQVLTAALHDRLEIKEVSLPGYQ